MWVCRICPERGGDALALVQHVKACNFPKALDYLLGEADVVPDPAEVARRKAKAEAVERRRQEAEAAQRAKAIRQARETWHAAEGIDPSPAQDYLAARGVQFQAWPPTLRFHPDHPYMKHFPDSGMVEWFRGPCMIAGIQDATGQVRAVHQTWIDPTRPGKKTKIKAPDGSLVDAKGKAWPAKMVRGSKKGGATGGELIMIRRLMKEAFEFTPEFKLVISGNYKPEVRGADDGIWRRILLVLWSVQIAAEDVDPYLGDKLWAERDGVLAWMVQGCLDWMQGGLRPPASIGQATQDYRLESDPMRQFLETECEITGSPSNFETGRDLGDCFNAWLLDSGTSAWGKRQTSNQLKRRADNVKGVGGLVYTPAKRSTTGYLGIRISPEARDRLAAFSEQLRGAK